MNLSPKKSKGDDLDESLQSYSRSQLMELMQQHEQQTAATHSSFSPMQARGRRPSSTFAAHSSSIRVPPSIPPPPLLLNAPLSPSAFLPPSFQPNSAESASHFHRSESALPLSPATMSHTLLPPGRRLDAGDDHAMELYGMSRNAAQHRWNNNQQNRAFRQTSSLTATSSEDTPMSVDDSTSSSSFLHSSSGGNNSTMTQASPPLLIGSVAPPPSRLGARPMSPTSMPIFEQEDEMPPPLAAPSRNASRRSVFSWSRSMGGRTSSQISLATSRGSTAAELECLYRNTSLHRQASTDTTWTTSSLAGEMGATAASMYLLRNTSQASVRRPPPRPDNPMVQQMKEYYGSGESCRSSGSF
jgi:hypothetical protein